MASYLLVDDREHAIIKELNTIAAELESRIWSVKRLACGDFQIVGNTSPVEPILTIERKTYADFTNSVRSGHIHNIGTLDSLRQDHPNMKIGLLLEGTRPRSERESINGLPYKNIRVLIHRWLLCYDLHIFETLDARETARYLLDLVADISSLSINASSLQMLPNTQPIVRVQSYLAGSLGPVPPLPAAPAPAPARPKKRSVTSEVRDLPAASSSGARSVASTSRIRRKSDFEIVKSLFGSCHGIGPTTAEKFIRANISFSAFARGLLPASCPSQLIKFSTRYRQGRSTAMDTEILRHTGVTSQMAEELLHFANPEQPTLASLCALSQDQLQGFRFRKRLQKSLMANIFKYLHYGEA